MFVGESLELTIRFDIDDAQFEKIFDIKRKVEK